jgi:hypothetical protein
MPPKPRVAKMSVSGAPSSSGRTQPSTVGVEMGVPNNVGETHAKRRLDYQLRALAIVWLLRAIGSIKDSAQAEVATTLYQHGLAGEGEQAAHKIMASLRIGGQSLTELCTGSTALRTLLIFLHADTSILPRVWNMADDFIEDQLRPKIGDYANTIISTTTVGAPYEKYDGCIRNIWGLFRNAYISACDNLKTHCEHKTERAKVSIAKTNDLLRDKKLLEGKRYGLNKELQKATYDLNDYPQMKPVAEMYGKVAHEMSFPLPASDLDNLWYLVFGGYPIDHVTGHQNRPVTDVGADAHG